MLLQNLRFVYASNGLETVYMNWNPNNAMIDSDKKDCVIASGVDGYWENVPCEAPFPYVCATCLSTNKSYPYPFCKGTLGKHHKWFLIMYN